MTKEEIARQKVIETITSMLQTTPFTFELKVVKKPKGIKIIREVTQEEMDALTQQVVERSSRIEKVEE
jgi:hypothetical protein